MSNGARSYSIVVAGNMNPAIHHPFWYKSLSLISDEEVKEATANAGTFAAASGSQLIAKRFRILCQFEKWEIHFPELAELASCLQIAIKTFRVLEHTPVAAFGANLNAHVPTKKDQVAKHLASCVNRDLLGLGSFIPEGASFSLQSPKEKDRTVHVKIEPSVTAKNAIFLSLNVHHEIQEQAIFDLGAKLEANGSRDFALLAELESSIISAVNR